MALKHVNSISQLAQVLKARQLRFHIYYGEIARQCGMPLAWVDGIFQGDFIPEKPRFESLLKAIAVEDFKPWHEARKRAYLLPYVSSRQPKSSPTAKQPAAPSVSVAGDYAQVHIHAEPAKPPDEREDAAAQKVRYAFRFLNHALWQSTITFALSMAVTTAGSLILLVGAWLAVQHAGDQQSNYPSVITALSGVVITACGGAFTVQSNKARKHATEQTDRVREELKGDLAHERASKQIANIQDPDLRDRLLAISALKELDLSPAPVDLDRHLPIKKVESVRLPSGENE